MFRFTCPSCKVNLQLKEVPPEGKKVQCPKCQAVSPVGGAPAPAGVPVDAVEDSAGRSDAYEPPAEPPLSRFQSRVQAYLTDGLNRYHAHARRWLSFRGFAYFPVLALLGAGIALLLMFVLYEVLLALGRFVGPWTNYGLYLAAVLTLAIALLARPRTEAGRVTLRRTPGGEPYFSLGYFDHYTNPLVPRTYMVVFGLLFGLQMGLHYWTIDHGGLAIEGGLLQCFLLPLDNVCKVMTLDVLELYDVHLAGPMEANYFSSSIFWVFHLAFAAVLVLLLRHVWRLRDLEILFQDWPGGRPESYRVAAWAEETFGASTALPRLFPDECFFLLLAAQFLRGNYDQARELARTFSWIRVAPDVRELFIDPGGKPLFESADVN